MELVTRLGPCQKSNVAKVAKPPCLRIEVPKFIKQQYRNPGPKIPPSHPRMHGDASPPPGVKTVSEGEQKPVDWSKVTDEQDEWLRQLVALQTGILKSRMER